MIIILKLIFNDMWLFGYHFLGKLLHYLVIIILRLIFNDICLEIFIWKLFSFPSDYLILIKKTHLHCHLIIIKSFSLTAIIWLNILFILQTTTFWIFSSFF